MHVYLRSPANKNGNYYKFIMSIKVYSNTEFNLCLISRFMFKLREKEIEKEFKKDRDKKRFTISKRQSTY